MSSEAADALSQELARLENALAHLERSQTELRAALAEEPGEREYVEALRENVDVMASYCLRVQELRAELERLQG